MTRADGEGDGVSRALITGATGYVGSRLSLRLRLRGWHVVAVHRPTSELPPALRAAGVIARAMSTPADAADALHETAPDAVFHLAAHHTRHPTSADIDPSIEANVSLGAHLLDAMSGTPAVLVAAQSYFQYRDGAPAAHSLYAATKQAFSDIARFYRESRGVDAREVVLFDNYGPDDPRDKLVPSLLRAAREDAALTIGPLEQPIDLLHVDDVVQGLIAAMGEARGSGVPVTLRAAAPITVGDVVASVGRAAGRPVRYEVRPGSPVTDLPLHAGSWRRPDGWAPHRSLDEGIADAYAVAGR